MSLKRCAGCEEFAAAYQRAAAARVGAEAGYRVATFAHDAETINIARQALRCAIGKYRRAGAQLEKHQGRHVMTSAASRPL